MPGVARLLAWFEAAGCRGAVLAGTNGEGPSLSAVEKRDLLERALPISGKLGLILGIATPSLEEAKWLARRASGAGVAILCMPPFYFRDATEQAIIDWFLRLMDSSAAPVLIYNFPQKTGITITAEMMNRLSEHERFAGLKDSSGRRENLSEYAEAAGDCLKFVGNEELLLDALALGWSGTISGAANVVPHWLTQIVESYVSGSIEVASAKFDLLLPVIRALRGQPQPALNKALLVELGVLPSADLRLPLTPASSQAVVEVAELLRARLGIRPSRPVENLPSR